MVTSNEWHASEIATQPMKAWLCVPAYTVTLYAALNTDSLQCIKLNISQSDWEFTVQSSSL